MSMSEAFSVPFLTLIKLCYTHTHTNWCQLATRKWHDMTCKEKIFLVNISSLPHNTEVKRLRTRQTRKLRNSWETANPMRQIWDSGLSGSAFQSQCSWLQCPDWGHWATSMVTGIYYSQTHPCAWSLLSQTWNPSPSPSIELEWETAFSIALGAMARLEEQVWTQQVHACFAHLLS